MQLPAKLADVRDPDREDPRVVQVDLAGGEVRERLVGQVGAGERLQQLAGARTLDREQGGAGGDVGHGRDLVVPGVALDPGRHPPVDQVGHDHQEPRLAQPGDRQVGDDPAGRVEPLRVDDPPHRDRDVRRAHAVEHRLRVAALDQELGHDRHVQHAHGLADRAVLGRLVVEARVAAPALGQDRPRAIDVEPLRVLPARRDREPRPGRGEPVVDHGPAHVAGGPGVPGREAGVPEQRPQLLHRAIPPEPAARLEGLRPVHA